MNDIGTQRPRSRPAGPDLTACVRSATAAPSLHNSQPWRFHIGARGVEVYADPHRRLDVLDPTGREMLISVGAAMFTLRLAIRGAGYLSDLKLFPVAAEPDLVARVTVRRSMAPPPAAEALVAAIPHRHTNRWPFVRSVVPADAVERLVDAARREGATLTVAGAASRNAILSLSQQADRVLRAKGRYRAELARWTSPHRGRRDGVPSTAIGPWDALEVLPIRDFGLLQPRLDRPVVQFEPYPTIMVLSTDGDTRRHWVGAGQALQRVLLTATWLNLSTTPISQPVEIPAVRRLLTDTRTGKWAQIVLRVGYGRPATATPRRRLAEVLIEDGTE
ncbi:Acg family FMN-binding oxidoreductase [Jidongwangia harbinensis]|uniref:Acg family FMN-binding oxidoreductase n=1 Tax=Jidongwangia harbinensis TaxID=2878561 RepID=UPI001CD92C53|nr:nitroreductase family protein [Jidongwangia harbinensis]MCA2218983.1 nitroreductase family protein [Jidongwangia harbinensis]